MRLTQDEFDTRIEQSTLHIALIGMSNIGKSHWSRQIQNKHGFSVYEVDQGIQETLSLASMDASAQWMGYPHEDGYAGKVKTYLGHEERLTLEAAKRGGNTVLDTTGSVVHLESRHLATLQKACLTVYLQASQDNIETLIKRFHSSPKPLIWGEYYAPKAGKTHQENLALCYPSLLAARGKLYADLADVTLNAQALGTTGTTDFLSALRAALPATL